MFIPKSRQLEGNETYFVLASRMMNLLQTENLSKFVKSSQDVFTTSRKREIRSKLAWNAINLSIKDTIIPFIIKFISTNEVKIGSKKLMLLKKLMTMKEDESINMDESISKV
jgi:hypothetical protein